MAKYKVKAPDGQEFDVNAPEGATEQDAIAYVQREFYGATKSVDMPEPKKEFGQKVDAAIGDTSLGNMGRQLGLAARYGLQGTGDVLDFLSSPIRMGLNAAGADIQGRTGEVVADKFNLPKPKGVFENTVGKATEFAAGSVLPLKLGETMSNAATPVIQRIGDVLKASPVTQVASAASAGGAGEYVKQTGGSPTAQFASSLFAGILPQSAVSATKIGVNAVKNLTTKPDPQKIDIVLQQVIDGGDYGIQYANVAGNIKAQLRNDIKSAASSGNLNDVALKRLVDYRLVGATPTKGTLTLDPAQLTREKNLAKTGMNTADESLQTLGNIQNKNNQTLIEGLNSLGANTSDDAYSAGQKVIGAINARNQSAKGVINQFYDKARQSSGRAVDLDGAVFTQTADDLLKKNLLQGKLDPEVRKHLNDIAQGKVPFNVDYAEQLKTLMGDIQRSNPGTAEAKALGLVRQALDNTPAMSGLGDDAINAFNQARKVNKAWMNVVDKTPALQAVRDGVEPDKFVQQFIIGSGSKSNVMDVYNLRNIARKNPEAMDAIKGQILSHLKGKALNGSADEVGNFSQSAYNKALQAIGERKLSAFFTPDELSQIKAIGRVASYEQFQPRGSAINNSNSGALALGNMLDWLSQSKVLSRIPFADTAVRTPARNFSTQVQIGNATNVPSAITAPQQKQPWPLPLGLLMTPLAMQQ